MARISKTAIWLGATGLLLVCATAFSVHRYYYPHGFRTGKLSTFMQTLQRYAEDHDGWYPRNRNSALKCLQQLFPDYASEALAGMSGNESRVKHLLRNGEPLTEADSSWVYWPGFRLGDNPQIAIIWEREQGIFVNGSRADGWAVGFVDGGYDQIPSEKWGMFLREQSRLRETVQANR